MYRAPGRCSGSMRGSKLAQAKEAVRQALRRLHDGDVFSLVIFSEDVKTAVAPTALDAHTRSVVESALQEIEAGGPMPPTRELKLQAIRIGGLGIAAIPCEVYGSTGLAIKAASPLDVTMNISLANGCEGYIAPPEQHELGGYTTWRARTSCLELMAEPKIKAAAVGLLVEVAAASNLKNGR